MLLGSVAVDTYIIVNGNNGQGDSPLHGLHTSLRHPGTSSAY